MASDESALASGRSASPQPVPCKVCTILIGEGYLETRPFPSPDGHGVVCWRCYESLRRQEARGQQVPWVERRGSRR